MKPSFGVSPLRTTITTPSTSTERITPSVAAINGGESMTMNLYSCRSIETASLSRREESRSAGFGGTGPGGMAARLVIAGWGKGTSAGEEYPAREDDQPRNLPSALPE